MAKKRKKAKSLLPKRVAGVKIPRSIRKGRAGRFLTSPLGMTLISQALAAAGAATAVQKADPESKLGKLRDHPKSELGKLKTGASDSGDQAVESFRGAISAASVAFARALRNGADLMEGEGKKASRREPQTAH